jgi:TolB protein
MNADGSGKQNLTRNPGNDGPRGFPAAWSPDGRKIAFVSNRDGTNEVYVMNADGSAQRRLTHRGS